MSPDGLVEAAWRWASTRGCPSTSGPSYLSRSLRTQPRTSRVATVVWVRGAISRRSSPRWIPRFRSDGVTSPASCPALRSVLLGGAALTRDDHMEDRYSCWRGLARAWVPPDPSNRNYEGETSHSGPRRCAAMGERRRRSIPGLPRSDPGAEALPGHRAGHAESVNLRRLRAGDRGLVLRPLDAAGPQDHGRAALVGPNPVLG
jgi:hypothetical protein